MASFFQKWDFVTEHSFPLKKSQNGENLPPKKKKKKQKKKITTMRQYIGNEGQNFCNSQKGFAQI